jgi:two-component system, OmpR family, sensor kinase
VSRVPIRVRLAVLLALAMMLVLAGAGLFVYVRLSSALDESVDSALEARLAAVVRSGEVAAGSVGDAEDGFAQLLAADGRVLARTGGSGEPALTRTELEQAAAGEDVEAEREVAGVDGSARMLAAVRGDGLTVAVVGQSLDDRDETLAALAGAFAIGAPVAALVVALLGYALAATGLRPVERMRRRAAGISLEGREDRLPLPAARDEIRRLGTTLNEMLDRLRRSYERERRFVADASHELRTPVAVIKAELEAALRRAPADPELREALAAAAEECDRLAQLAEDLLVLARSGDGALPVRPEPLDAAELLERVRTRFTARAGEREREISVAAEPDLALQGDELRLTQALGNLVDNALRHGSGAIALRARRAGAAVELEVADEGAGPPPELRARAFERFARGDEARTRGGAGLGLAIVRAIAEAHGGVAELAEGSRVVVRLPSQGDPSSCTYGAAHTMQGGPA